MPWEGRNYYAQDTDTLSGHIALAWISKLYDVEDIEKNKSDEERLALRRTLSIPLLLDFNNWLDDAALRLPPCSIIGNALGYIRNHWAALCRYTGQGFLAIDNNAAYAARGIRQIVHHPRPGRTHPRLRWRNCLGSGRRCKPMLVNALRSERYGWQWGGGLEYPVSWLQIKRAGSVEGHGVGY